MKQDLIDKMKSKKRLILTFKQALTHYFIVPFLLLVPFWTVIDLYQIYISKNYNGMHTGKELIISCLPFLALALLFAIIQYRRLNFKSIKISFTKKQFQEALRRTKSDLNWKVKINNEEILIAYRPNDWKSGSWGEMITIIKGKEYLLMNSICDPESTSSVVSFGSNSRNLKAILMNLMNTIHEIPETKEIETKINNWSFKEVTLRVLLYPFCIFLIIFGFYMVFEMTTIQSRLSGFGAILASVLYFYSDYKLILKNRNA